MTLDYISHLRDSGSLMAAAAARDMDAHVPTCPEWNVTQLVTHTGRHHRWVRNAVQGGGAEPADTVEPGLSGDDLIEWFQSGWQGLADLLEGMDSETPAWSWAGDNRVGFWKRRTALETLVHRWDAENATGATSPLDAHLASDGVGEMIHIFFPDTEAIYNGDPGMVGLESTDAEGAWFIALQDGKIPSATLLRDGPKPGPDVWVSATAADLLLFLWGRLGPEAVEISGDTPVFEAFRSWLDA